MDQKMTKKNLKKIVIIETK